MFRAVCSEGVRLIITRRMKHLSGNHKFELSGPIDKNNT